VDSAGHFHPHGDRGESVKQSPPQRTSLPPSKPETRLRSNHLEKLEELVSTDLADRDRCSEVLQLCRWDVDAAMTYLIVNSSSGRESPELVHV